LLFFFFFFFFFFFSSVVVRRMGELTGGDIGRRGRRRGIMKAHVFFAGLWRRPSLWKRKLSKYLLRLRFCGVRHCRLYERSLSQILCAQNIIHVIEK